MNVRKNKILSALVCSILFLIVVAPFAASLGVSYNRQAIAVAEGEQDCATYYVYNTDEQQIAVTPKVVGDLTDVIVPLPSEPVTIPENTPVPAAIPIEFCFEIADNIYSGDCDAEPVDYIGTVLITQVPDSDGGSGSDVSVGVAAPLTVRASCEASDTSTTGKSLFRFVYPLLTLILTALIITSLIRRSKQQNAEATGIQNTNNTANASVKQ